MTRLWVVKLSFKLSLLTLLLTATVILVGCQRVVVTDEENNPQASGSPQSQTTTTDSEPLDQVKSAHFVSAQPVHGDTLNAAPTKVVLKFNFTLGSDSKISIMVNGKEVAGDTEVSVDKLSLNAPITSEDPGIYNVRYTACWPDGSCHDGTFSFSVK